MKAVKQNATQEHQAVLLDQAMQALNIRANGLYIDATYGRGGHSARILQQLNASGRLIAFDKDPDACAHAQQHFGDDARFEIHLGSFLNIANLIESLRQQVNGILFDLGVSSPQLDTASRGFSFYHDGSLDMRMDPQQGPSVYEWLCSTSPKEVERVLREYGEERHARRIAYRITRQPIPKRTLELAQRVMDVCGSRHHGHKHPATRTFLALRLYINQELEELRAILPSTLDLLALGGRLVVISFHSLEDRIVKYFMRKFSTLSTLPHRLPLRNTQLKAILRVVNRSIVASVAECSNNPRARSARLRCAEKIATSMSL